MINKQKYIDELEYELSLKKKCEDELYAIRDYCQRKTHKEADLWKAAKELFELFNLDWEKE